MTTRKEKTRAAASLKAQLVLFHIFMGHKMNAGLEKAIQEDMMELDRMTDD